MSRHPSGVFGPSGRRNGHRLSNPNDPAVRLALARKCPDCAAEPEQWCVGIAENSRTKGRRISRIHFNRCEFVATDAPVKAGAR